MLDIMITMLVTAVLVGTLGYLVTKWLIVKSYNLGRKVAREELESIKKQAGELKATLNESLKKMEEKVAEELKALFNSAGKEIEEKDSQIRALLEKLEVASYEDAMNLDFAQRKYVWCGLRKLTIEELEEIKTKDFGQLTHEEIGEIYGISRSRVGQILEKARHEGKRKA